MLGMDTEGIEGDFIQQEEDDFLYGGQTQQLNSYNQIYNQGSSYLKILEYFQEEKTLFKDKVNFEEIEKFIYKYFDATTESRVKFNDSTHEKLGLRKLFFLFFIRS